MSTVTFSFSVQIQGRQSPVSVEMDSNDTVEDMLKKINHIITDQRAVGIQVDGKDVDTTSSVADIGVSSTSEIKAFFCGLQTPGPKFNHPEGVIDEWHVRETNFELIYNMDQAEMYLYAQMERVSGLPHWAPYKFEQAVYDEYIDYYKNKLNEDLKHMYKVEEISEKQCRSQLVMKTARLKGFLITFVR